MSKDRSGGERFVVQKASGKKWETLTVHDAQADGATAFAAAVRGAPRTFLRLIRLQADPDARGEVYDWTLVSLHDPRRNPVPPAAPPDSPARRKSADKSTGRRQPAEERVRVPVRLYIGLFLSGAALVMLWLLAGRLR
jgi:hypothetical protein